MYIFERNLSKKSMSTTNSRIQKIFTFILKIARLTLVFLLYICECVHVNFLGLSNPYICWNARSVHFMHTYRTCRRLFEILEIYAHKKFPTGEVKKVYGKGSFDRFGV